MNSKRGFTLIELLIVIALLGALAVGLIGALDPFEQLKKGSDTATRDLVNQVQTAVIRYYSVKNQFPWCTPAGVCTDPTEKKLNDAAMVDPIARIVAAGELKSDFTTIQADKMKLIYITGNSTTNTAIVCYIPTAKSFKSDPNTKYVDAKGTADTLVGGVGSCITNGGAADCYWCIQ